MNAAINTIITVLNSAGRGFAEYATGLFVQSSVLIVLILILDFALRKRVRAVFRYCVWMLVFTKLVLPTSFTLPTGVGYWLGDFLPAGLSAARNPADMEEAGLLVMPNQQPEPARNDAVVVETPPSVIDYRSQLNVGESPATVPATSMARPDVGASQIELQPISWQGGLFLGWLVGMLALSVLLVQRARYVRRLLAQAKQPDERLQDLLGECRIAMGMTCDVGLRISKEMVSPAVCGLVRPTILLPRYLVEKLSREKLRAVLLHECAHVKRWDLWINLVQTVLQIAYFYNPFVWLANATVRKVREQAVDETVLVALRGESDSYSNTLIDIGEMAFWRPNFSLRLIGVVESKKALAARIKHIAARPMPKSAELGVVGLIAVVLIGVVLLPMAKAERSASRPSVIENPYVRIDQPVESMIYWTDPDRRKILRADLDGTSVTEIVSTKTALFDVALDLVHGKVYWTEPEARLIKRANLDGSYIEVVAESLENPACIALDPQRGKIYWTDLQGGRIRRANLDGSAIEDLVSTGLEKPEGICIDTARGRIYWTDIGTRKIQRANMDGTYVEDLVTSEVKYPRGIVLDVGAEKMYWTDLFPPRIRRANMDGSRVEDVIKAERLSPDGRRGRLYVDYVDPDDGPRVCDYDPESVLRDPDILRLHLEAGKMYWTDLYKKKVLCANLDGTGVREVITGYGPRGIDLALSAPVSVPGMPAGTSGRSVDLSRPQTPRASEPALVVHWKFDEGSGTMTYDSAGKNHGIVQGAVWTTGKIGTGLGFDGVDDVVNTAMNLDQSRSSRPVTFCAWVYPTSISAGRHQVISSDNRGYDWSLLRQADTWYVFTGENSRSTGFSVDLFTWQHVAAAFVPGAGVRFYKNGNEFTIPHIDYDDRDNNIAIGDNPGLGEEFFAGVIDDVRIYNTALSAEEVEQIRGITARRRKAPAGYWKFDEGGGSMAYDSAGTNHAVIKGARWTGGRVNGGLSFDGVDDRVKIPGSTVSGTELTLNLWVKTSDDTYSLVSGANEECDNEYLLYVHSGHGSKLEIYYHDNVGLLGTGFYSTDIVTNDGMWHMITVVTSLNETRVYVDGFLKEVAGYGSENSFNIEGLWIGAEQDRVNGGWDADQQFNGIIDEVMIFHRTLYADEINRLYQTQSRSRPAARLAGPTETAGVSGKAYYFDGHDDMIEIPESDSLDISGKEITVSAWIKAGRIDRRQVIAAKNALGINSWILEINPIDFSEGHINFYLDLWGIDGNFGSRTAVTTDTWYHVAGVYNGNERRIYVNGRFDAAQMVSREIPTNDQPVTIGGWGTPDRYFSGSIDEAALFRRALSAEQIGELYNNPGWLSGNEPGLVGYWDFNGDHSDTVIDKSPYRNNGKLKEGKPEGAYRPADLQSTPLLGGIDDARSGDVHPKRVAADSPHGTGGSAKAGDLD